MGNNNGSSNGESLVSSKICLSPGNDETFQPAPVPVDRDGFVASITLDREDEILKFFEKHGVVVIGDVLTGEQCQRSVDEVWQFLREMFNPSIRRDNPETWTSGWPTFSKMGILGNDRWLYPQACDNRQNPNVYKAFRILFGDPELIVNVTRAGLMRPTKGVHFPELQKTENRDDWKTISEWLHMDMNPLTGRATTYGFENVAEAHFESCQFPLSAQNEKTNNGMKFRKLQGILALDDCRLEDGGFHAVPGFQHFAATWAARNQDACLNANRGGDPSTVQIPKDDPVRNHVQRMPIRRGSLLVWDNRLPHGNYPNDSNRMRIVQYLHMAPVADLALRPYPLTVAEDLPDDFQLTELGRKLYGFDAWRSSFAKRRFGETRNPKVLAQARTEREMRNAIFARNREDAKLMK